MVRLQDLATKWMQECKNADEQKDLIVREQLIRVKERKPKTSEEAGALAGTCKQERRAARKTVETQETASRRTNSDVVTVATSGGT